MNVSGTICRGSSAENDS